MTNIIKISFFSGFIAITFGFLAFMPTVSNLIEDSVFSPIAVFAYGGGGGDGGDDGGGGGEGGSGDGGCCGDTNTYSQGSYYSEGSYYSQGSYVTSTPPSCDAFTGSPTTLPAGGGNTTLTWATTNADSVTIDQGIGAVAVDGSQVVAVTGNTTFTLTATNTSGSVTCSVPIVVSVVSAPSCDAFSIDKTIVDKGESFTLTWATTNADSVTIDQGIGSVNVDGTYVSSTQTTKTYTLTAIKGAESVTCASSVSVRSGGGGGGGSSSPRCDIDASDETIKSGKEILLTWDTRNANEVKLKDSRGNTLIDTEDLSKSEKKDFYDGELKVQPVKDTTYTLTASSRSKDRDCSVKIKVDNAVVVLETRDQKPLVSGISLAQVPYTGFEAGPTLTFIFYTLLTFWALFMAYVLVVKKKVS